MPDTPLINAVRSGRAAEVRRLLGSSQPQLNVKGLLGNTAVHVAAFTGNQRIMGSLLEKRPSLDLKNNDEETALHTAAIKGNSRVIQLLVDAGANKSERNADGNHPLHVAAHKGHVECCKILIRAGAPLDATNYAGESVVDLACQSAEAGLSTMIRDMGAAALTPDSVRSYPHQRRNPRDFGRSHDELLSSQRNPDPRVLIERHSALPSLPIAVQNDFTSPSVNVQPANNEGPHFYPDNILGGNYPSSHQAALSSIAYPVDAQGFPEYQWNALDDVVVDQNIPSYETAVQPPPAYTQVVGENEDSAPAPEGDGQENATSSERSSRLCVICLSQDFNMVIQPCMHLCTCSQCQYYLQECPLCRGRVESSMEVFLP